MFQFLHQFEVQREARGGSISAIENFSNNIKEDQLEPMWYRDTT